mmetsp:Transcript_11611/g.31647  ORF Transcript_11611/g.31647 Transcript_11611/m.31647 type:complete len:259 (+) Transcript_11611:3369-4145(+)
MITLLPFLMVCLPMTASSTASMSTGRFSISMGSPFSIQYTTLSMYLCWDCWMITRPSGSSRFTTHLIPCNWGSIMRGHRLALVMIAPFSMDRGSVGRPSLAQRALVESSVSRSSGIMPWDMGIARSMRSGSHFSCTSCWRKCMLNGPAYDTKAAATSTSPTSRPSTDSMRLISLFQRVFSPDRPLIRRSASCALRLVFSACATAAFLSAVAFIRPSSRAVTLSCSSFTRARMPASFLLAPSSLRLASAKAARFGATTW